MAIEDSSSTVDLILRFIIDQQSQKSAQQAVGDLEKSFQERTGNSLYQTKSSGKSLFSGFTDNELNLLERIKETAVENKISFEEAAEAYKQFLEVGLGGGGKRKDSSVDELVGKVKELHNKAIEANKPIEEIDSTAKRISDSLSVNVRIMRDLAKASADVFAMENPSLSAGSSSSSGGAVTKNLFDKSPFIFDQSKKDIEQIQNEIKETIASANKMPSLLEKTLEDAKVADKHFSFYREVFDSRKNAKGIPDEFGGKSAHEANKEYQELIDSVGKKIPKAASAGHSAMAGFHEGIMGFQLQLISNQLLGFGDALLSPMHSFIKAQGFASESSGRFVLAQKEIENSTNRIGQSMMTTVVPAIEKAAKLAEQAADFIEKHPELATAAVGLAAGAYSIGSILQVLGSMLTVLSFLKTSGILSAGASAGSSAAGGAVSGAVGGGLAVGGAALAGVGAAALAFGTILGNILGNMVNSLTGQEWQSAQDNLVTVAKWAFLGTDLIIMALQKMGIHFGEATTEFMKFQNGIFDWLQNLGIANEVVDEANKLESDKTLITEQQIQAYISYLQAQTDAEKKYEDQRTSIVENAGQDRVDLELKYEERRTEIVDDFNQDQLRKAQDFLRDQANDLLDFQQSQRDAIRKFEESRASERQRYVEEERKAKHQHEKNLEKLAQDHENRVLQLSIARDAFGLLAEHNSYNQKVNDENERYSEEKRERARRFRLQMQQDEENFRQQQAIALRNFEEKQERERKEFELERKREEEDQKKKLAKLEEDYKKQLELSEKNEREKLDQLQKNFNDERIKRNNAFRDQMRDLGANFHGEQQLKLQYYSAMNADLRRFLDQQLSLFGSNLPGFPGAGGENNPGSNQNNPGGTPYASGGYARYGQYKLGDSLSGGKGDDEFVLTGKTTKLAERLVGGSQGSLSQENIMRALSGKQGTNMNVTITGEGISIKKVVEIVDNSIEELARGLSSALEVEV